ncbi:MAG: filamentous hemagglutinin N-terminal domain-containing protein, partial [Nitrospinaceae bacterium]|nr:filamentous hemagglutinin N-terminal domain-containing protein [Nitrospinaceae bacterium]
MISGHSKENPISNFFSLKNSILFLFFRNLLIVFLIWLIGAWPTIVFALPQDGQVVGGSGTITEPTATSMQIDQNTSQMIINWQSFNIGSAEWVNFTQPSSSSVALNRVIGSDPSLLLGKLTANGQVFITNGSGVFFGPGSRIDTHGLVATTMGISDQDFLNETYNFVQDLDNPLSSVINEGNISTASYVGLLAPAVENRGTIVTASLGSIDLASGTAATMDFTGDGLIQFEVTQAVSGTVTDKDGNVLEDRVSNTGLLQADGGQIRMSAKDAGDVIRHVVNMEGMIKANSVVEKNGKVFLMGGDSGVVNVSGTIDASGDDAGEKGGTVQVTGEYVGLFDNAVVDVSGDAGGGTALIGGDYQGKNPEIQNATANFVDQGASIFADALTTGDAGKIIVWADDVTRVYGTLSASAVTGDGGFIETSGKNYLDINIIPDISSIHGVGGEWLIDPNNIEIIAGSGNTNINTGSPFATTNDTAQLGVDLIITALGIGNVTITTGTAGTNAQSGDITLSTILDFDGTGTRTLTLIASNDIIFNAAIVDGTPGGDVLNLVLDAGGVVDVNANIDTGGGTFTATAGAGAVVFGTTVTINTGAYSATTTTVTAGTVDLNATSSIGTLTVTGGTLQGTGNITVTGAMTWNGGTIGGAGTLTTNSAVTTSMGGTGAHILSRVWDNNGTIN